jgi:hypothetical protein
MPQMKIPCLLYPAKCLCICVGCKYARLDTSLKGGNSFRERGADQLLKMPLAHLRGNIFIVENTPYSLCTNTVIMITTHIDY